MFNAVLENACSEQGARMSAMDSSSRNAGDMLDRLTLTYNRSPSLPLSRVLMYTCFHVNQILHLTGILSHLGCVKPLFSLFILFHS